MVPISSVFYTGAPISLINISFLTGSSWCVAPASDPTSQYLQVDLRSTHKVSAVSTQGAVNENSWVSTYLVHYSLDGKEWIALTDKGGEIKVCFLRALVGVVSNHKRRSTKGRPVDKRQHFTKNTYQHYSHACTLPDVHFHMDHLCPNILQ